ncbi:TetR/AcrR family transcriptional regulator [Rubrivirga sp. S365]|uniref:TetR/AcrR family transcriptional regulator n=1 Tax=Rubrivirga sp. S365 TaxID=3076080 RepID=UPI0028C82CF5|nr:TetR/AcrR family transcriptional regulator [Rubrivirga sp. S365]MDT7855044.1 TetR/AcrR family transcriptional regulator [Rubrivirga sp. S365]
MPTSTPPAPTLGRRERERLLRRAAMLDAALAVFAENGYAGASVDEIAERAEFGKGTIYNYFPGGKDELFLTLFEERVVGWLHEVVARSFPDDTDLSTPPAARAAFRGFIGALLRQFSESREALLMFMKEGYRTRLDVEHEAAFSQHFLSVIEAVARPIEAAVAAGALRPLPARTVAHVLMGNVRGYLMAEVDAECDPSGTFEPAPFGSSSEAAEFLTTVLFDGLLAP